MDPDHQTDEAALAALRFPPRFWFGVATSAHQVEGGTVNNWTRWERDRGESAGDAVGHWQRFERDLELLRRLGVGVYRFSVEWSRVEPEPGRFDTSALDRYRDRCASLRQAGIAPMVTLHHFTEPLWITDQGGFENPATIAAFTRFVARVVATLGDLVDWWVTVNEPVGYAVQGWWRGEWPPGRTDPELAVRVLEHLLLAHARAYRVIHREDGWDADGDGLPCRVGLAHNVVVFRPARWWAPADRAARWLVHAACNLSVAEALRGGRLRLWLPGLIRHLAVQPEWMGTQDYLGLNHYYPMTVAFRARAPGHAEVGFGGAERNDLGWAIDPSSLYDALRFAAGYRLPIVITEHGICDAGRPDARRQRFLLGSLASVLRALDEGIPVEGYVHWTLLDNYEWSHGYAPRFGLFRVDHATGERELTGGGELYRSIIAAQRA